MNCNYVHACKCLTFYQNSKHNKHFKWILECDQDRWGENCQNECLCVPGHTKYCHADNGHCECELGWSGSTCETDEDECLTQDTCDHETEICENTNGSYRCVCKPGLGRQENGECLGTHTVALYNIIQLFHAFVCNSQNYRSRGAVDDLMHCSGHETVHQVMKLLFYYSTRIFLSKHKLLSETWKFIYFSLFMKS